LIGTGGERLVRLQAASRLPIRDWTFRFSKGFVSRIFLNRAQYHPRRGARHPPITGAFSLRHQPMSSTALLSLPVGVLLVIRDVTSTAPFTSVDPGLGPQAHISLSQTCRRLRDLYTFSTRESDVWKRACINAGYGRPVRREYPQALPSSTPARHASSQHRKAEATGLRARDARDGGDGWVFPQQNSCLPALPHGSPLPPFPKPLRRQ